MIRSSLILILLLTLGLWSYGQEQPFLYGKVSDENGQAIELVNIAVVGYSSGTSSDEKGNYKLMLPASKEVFVDFSFIGFESKQFKVNLDTNESRELNVVMVFTSTDLPDIEITDKQTRSTNYMRIDPKEAAFIPTISGGIEDILTTLPGVTSSNEMSSQYSVRGGNFDENLVYVNGIEIYRPQLIRAGQQEGLSFIYPKLVSSITFSAGGFDAKYGDKMSSVLDIQYKRPNSFGGSFQASFMGLQAHTEGITKNKKFTYLVGARYQTNQYIFKGLETKGDYKPNFIDVQALLSFRFSDKLELSALGVYSRNHYNLTPESRETNFGTVQEAYKLKVYFDGKEVDRFITYTGALSLDYRPRNNISLKFIASAFETNEEETFDIQGQYWIGLLENAIGDDQFGDVVAVQGVGTHIDHARNTLNAVVYNVEHKGSMERKKSFINWGVKYQHEIIHDQLSEWEMIDSAGYSIPNPPTNIDSITYPKPDLHLNKSIKSQVDLNTNRYSAFIQDSWNFDLKNYKTLSLTAGIRASYWDYNHEFLLSPRVNLSFDPNLKKDIVFRFATGYYYQPPFYKELRDLEGNLNPDIKSQKSIHFVLGSDWNFKAWGRPFKFVAEAYYKILKDLIPYVVDNVRIRYYGDNVSNGYAVGLDMNIHGEFIKGIDSWASMSIMKTAEDIEGDYYYDYYNAEGQKIIPGYTIDDVAIDSNLVEPGYIPRPTDRRFNFSLLFQDYLPKNPTYRMHLRLVYGTGLPFGAPDSPKYTHTLRYPSYRRVDVGFSKQLIGGYSRFKEKNPLRHIKNAFITLEIFNILQIYNTVSYVWVSDVNGRQYAVPNYLTPRIINLKLQVEF